MRKVPSLIALLFVAFGLLNVVPTGAQRPASMPACDGGYNIVRASDIKPSKFETFLSAVSAQKAWYKKAGAADEISVLRVVDPKTGAFSETEALTFHKQAGANSPAHDAGYDAFVALFQQSSTIKAQYIACEAK